MALAMIFGTVRFNALLAKVNKTNNERKPV